MREKASCRGHKRSDFGASAAPDGSRHWRSRKIPKLRSGFVSGTDDKENFPYLLESNLRIEGRTEAEIKLLLGEWHHGFEITSRGGTFDDYLAATQTLR